MRSTCKSFFQINAAQERNDNTAFIRKSFFKVYVTIAVPVIPIFSGKSNHLYARVAMYQPV